MLHLCWLIGEYTSNSITTHFLVPPEILRDYHEALEIFAYERMSITKAKNEDFSENNSNNESISSTNSDFSTRLMLILISSMAKLAARWPPLISRVLLCLSKISNHRGFEEIVVTRANECLSLLKFPRFDPSIQTILKKSAFFFFDCFFFFFLSTALLLQFWMPLGDLANNSHILMIILRYRFLFFHHYLSKNNLCIHFYQLKKDEKITSICTYRFQTKLVKFE